MTSWELSLIALLAVAAFVPLIVRRRSLGASPWLLVSGAALLLAATGVLLGGAAARRADSLARIAATTPGPRPDYVTSDRCRACHPDQYQSWHRSYHRTMTQRASPEAVVADFDNVTLRDADLEFRLERRGDEFWVIQEGEGEWQAVMTTGSHHQQVFWVPMSPAKRLGDFAFLWLIEEKLWIPMRDAFLKHPDLPTITRTWNFNCLQCHVTGGQPLADPTTGAMDTRTGELGIACEACHGPADEHVSTHRDPLRRYSEHLGDDADPTIVNPSRLTPEASTQVCGQCHGISFVPSFRDFNAHGFRYRPGDDLEATKPTIRPRHAASSAHIATLMRENPGYLDAMFWSDGMVRVSGRDMNGMIESPCAVRGDLQCLSCHSMHDSEPVNQLSQDMEGNAACVQCHPAFSESLQEHTHHAPESSGSQCMNCHMPYTVYGLLKTIRSHEIDSPALATEIATGRPNACNLCHLDQSLGWTSAHLADWYGQPGAARLTDDQRDLAAGARWMLAGDAGQRAIAADAIARAASRSALDGKWATPHLALLLDDDYGAVRFIAARTLRQLGEPAMHAYDWQSPRPERQRVAGGLLRSWRASAAPDKTRLIRADGSVDLARVDALISERDNRKMDLRE